MPDRVLSVTQPRWGTQNTAIVHQNDKKGPVLAKVRLRMMTDGGRITFSQSGERYRIKHSICTSRWKLQLVERNARPFIEAKMKYVQRTKKHYFEMQLDGESYEMVLEADKQTFQVSRLMTDSRGTTAFKIGHVLAETGKRGDYTFCYSAVFDDRVRIDLVLFCIWLAHMLTRRMWAASKSSSSSGGGGGGHSSSLTSHE